MQLELRVHRARKPPAAHRRKWKSALKGLDDELAAGFVTFLGEVLEILTGQAATFSGYKKAFTGIGEERWELAAGRARISRDKATELSESWQRVEVLADRTEVRDLPEGKFLAWDGEYDVVLGLKLSLRGLSQPEAARIQDLARALFDEVEVSGRQPRRRQRR